MVLLLAAKRYSFKNDQGEQVEGTTLHYLDIEGGPSNEASRVGFEPLTITAPLEVFESVQEVPALYSLDWRQRPGKNGRPTLSVTGLKWLSTPPFLGRD